MTGREPAGTRAEIPSEMQVAATLGRLDVAVETRPVPDPGPGEALVQVAHCGICGSDLHFILEWGPMRPGSIGGHEWSGEIVAVGEGVDPDLVGRLVIGGPGARCGTCRHCREGRPSLCEGRGRAGVDDFQGAFAQFTRTRADELVAVPEGLSLRHAALTEPLAVSLHAITRGSAGHGAQPGQRWLVTGGGPIGYLAAAVLAAQNVEVTVSEPHERRRELCTRLGAVAVHPDDLTAVPEMPMDEVAEPFDVALECSGRADAMETALGLLRRGGTLVLVGAGMQRPKLDPNRILLNELVVTGANTYDGDGFERALEWLASGRLNNDELVEADDVGLVGLLDAAVALGRGDLARKVLVSPGRNR